VANNEKTVARAKIQCGWNWTTAAKPMLPGCPDWCPATHFGFMKKGKMEVRMKDSDKWMLFEEGDAYFVPPGHLPRFPEDTEFVEFSQDQVIKTYAGDSGEASPAPVPAPAAAMAPPPSKITYKKMAPTKEMKDSNGKKATAFMQKLAQGEKLVNRIVIEEGFEWTTGVKPHLPGCPEHCPATHFGFIAAGQMEIQMKGSDEWVCFGPGDAYNVPPGHLPRFTKGETVMMEFSSDPTYTNANFISGLNFFVIQHTFKAGKAEEWWGKFKDVMADPQGMENMAKAAHDAGFHNHAFLPMPDASGTVHCVWEAQPGKGVKDMQAFIDGPAGPSMGCMDNIVFGPVDAATAQLAYTPFFGNSNASAPPAEVKGSTMYMIQHHIKEGQGPAMWENMGKLMADPSAMEGMSAKHKAQGFVNHFFMPFKGKTDGLFACCLWEAKEGLTEQQVQEMIDEHPGVGPFCDNKVFALDATKANIGLAQVFEASPEALKGAPSAATVKSPQKSVA